MPRDKHKVTHENIDEKFDGIQIERYTSHLSDPTHLQVSVCRYVQLQSPLTSAFSKIVILSKSINVCTVVCGDLRSSGAEMAPDRSLSTETNHDQSLKVQTKKSRQRALSSARVYPTY